MKRRFLYKIRNSSQTILAIIFLILLFTWRQWLPLIEEKFDIKTQNQVLSFNLEDIPEFDESTPYVVLNDNIPDFSEKDFTSKSFETYGELDELGRCTVAFANVGIDTMPTAPREQISHIKPTGWRVSKYDFIEGELLFNRCHLIGFQLTAENDNERNLITGTRYMNAEGMLPFEIEVGDYIKETKNHVLYRVTPIFEGENLIASGVQMEAESVEDRGEGVMFNVYVYNCQPNIGIDYATGENWLIKE